MDKELGYKKITESYITVDGDLICKFKESCELGKTNGKCVGGFWGDNNSEVLIIAESPSGEGKFFGKSFGADLDKNQKALSEFIKDNFNGSVAFFTDAVKCSVGELTGKSKAEILNDSFKWCIEHLRKEIEYLKPKVIFCVGEFSYKKITDNSEYLFENVLQRPGIYKIMHYSNRRSVDVNIEVKKNIIWPLEFAIQSGMQIDEEGKNITELSYFQKLIKSNES